MSKIKHAVSDSWPEFRNSSAEAKASTLNPTDLRRLLSASRTASSSSTIEIFWISATLAFPLPHRRSCTLLRSVAAGEEGFLSHVGFVVFTPSPLGALRFERVGVERRFRQFLPGERERSGLSQTREVARH